jgi:hypothetical protein
VVGAIALSGDLAVGARWSVAELASTGDESGVLDGTTA